MIISASRRTDIPACYSDWFFNRMKEGYALVRNPMNPNRVSRIDLSPETVDGIVFWTKNPEPMLTRLKELKDYAYYFQFTLNAYGSDLETNVPSKKESVIPFFKRLSDMLGADRVLWRYDPILLSSTYTMEYHAEYFDKLAGILKNYTKSCTVSFLNFYGNTAQKLNGLDINPINAGQKMSVANMMEKIGKIHGLKMYACAEELDFSSCDIEPAHCIDKALMEKICGYPLKLKKDSAQRPACGCFESIDIGAYGTCTNGCKYCYADRWGASKKRYDPNSAMLCDELKETDIVTERKVRSLKDLQLTIFEKERKD